jgi:hypothetical protein
MVVSSFQGSLHGFLGFCLSPLMTGFEGQICHGIRKFFKKIEKEGKSGHLYVGGPHFYALLIFL